MSDADRRAQRQMQESVASVNEWIAENRALGGVCDFCCAPLRGRTVVTFVTGAPIAASIHALTDDLGAASAYSVMDPEWAACELCSPVVRQRDPDLLVAHVLAHRHRRASTAKPDAAAIADLRELYVHFFAELRGTAS